MTDHNLEQLLQCIEPFVKFIDDFDRDKKVPGWFELAHSRKGWEDFLYEKVITVDDLRRLADAVEYYKKSIK